MSLFPPPGSVSTQAGDPAVDPVLAGVVLGLDRRLLGIAPLPVAGGRVVGRDHLPAGDPGLEVGVHDEAVLDRRGDLDAQLVDIFVAGAVPGADHVGVAGAGLQRGVHERGGEARSDAVARPGHEGRVGVTVDLVRDRRVAALERRPPAQLDLAAPRPGGRGLQPSE